MSRIIDPATWMKGGRRIQIRMSINIGAKKGIMDKITVRELLGFRRTNTMSNIGTIKNILIGMMSCWASFSELTIEPTAAYNVP